MGELKLKGEAFVSFQQDKSTRDMLYPGYYYLSNDFEILLMSSRTRKPGNVTHDIVNDVFQTLFVTTSSTVGSSSSTLLIECRSLKFSV